MDENKTLPSNQYGDDEIDLMEYARTIWKYRKFIAVTVSVTFFISTIVSFLLPKQYMAKALISAGTIGRDEAGKYVSMLKGMAGGFFNVGSASTSNMQVMGLLKSMTLADYLIDTFGLMKEFGTTKRDSARATILSILNGKETKEELIEISLEYKDPQKAALLVNESVAYLDQMINDMNISGVSKQREFLEKRLAEVTEILTQSENRLKEFEEKHKIVDIQTQTSSTVSTLSMINAQLIEVETELGIKTRLKSSHDPELFNLQAKITELKKQQEKIIAQNPELEAGYSGSKNEKRKTKNENYLISLAQAPAIGLEFLRLKRQLKIQETLFELLTEQYEMAKIDETKNLPKITIIDRATVPENKFKPQRKIIIMLSVFIAFIFVVILSFIDEFLKRKLILKNKTVLTK